MKLRMEMRVTGLREAIALCEALRDVRNALYVGRSRKPKDVRAFFAECTDDDLKRLSHKAQAINLLSTAIRDGSIVDDSR